MPCALDDRYPRFRRSDRSALTSEQNGAYLTFENADSFRDCRRGQIEPACSFGDRTVIDRHQKGLNKPRIHFRRKVSSEETIVYFCFAMADAKQHNQDRDPEYIRPRW